MKKCSRETRIGVQALPESMFTGYQNGCSGEARICIKFKKRFMMRKTARHWRCKACQQFNRAEDDSCLNCLFPKKGVQSAAKRWDIKKGYATPTEPTIFGSSMTPSLYCPNCRLLMYPFDRECPHCSHVLTQEEHDRQPPQARAANIKGMVFASVLFPFMLIVLTWLYS